MPTITTITANFRDIRTDLCTIGADCGADKSPYNTATDYSHSYTPLYATLFAPLQHSPLTVIGEMGILNSASIRMWRQWFDHAQIHCWDLNHDYIRQCSELNLSGVHVGQMDVTDADSIRAGLSSGGAYNILIDDTTHDPLHAPLILGTCTEFLKPGAYFIIEDVIRSADETIYQRALDELDLWRYYSTVSFVLVSHDHSNVGGFDNDKLLVLARNNTPWAG